MSAKRESLEKLLTLIEQQLNWGSVEDWTSADFENLSDLIYEKTEQRLSVTTLKRSWGRTSQHVTPSTTTLNILAQYVGASSWRDFQFDHQESIREEAFEAQTTSTQSTVLLSAGGVILGLLVLTMIMSMIWKEKDDTIANNIDSAIFEIQKVTTGIPNTVLFKYDVRGIVADSFELQQSWDKRKRQLIDATDTLVTSMYYYPGYFNAKLVADGQIIKNRNLYLSSDGFDVFTFFNSNIAPLRLTKDYWSVGADGFRFSADIDSYQKDDDINTFLLVNLTEEPSIESESFRFDMSFIMDSYEDRDPCNPMSLIITGTDEVYMFSFGHPGCSSNFSAYLKEEYIDGKNHDLSFMGFEEDQSINLSIVKNEEEVSFELGDKRHVLTTNGKNIGKIGGVRIFSAQTLRIGLLEIEDKYQKIDLLRASVKI